MNKVNGKRRDPYRVAVVVLLSSTLILFVLGAGVGSSGFTPLANYAVDPTAHDIVWAIRLPRTFGAYLAGALLGLTGAIAQGLFRNPLADPYLLGSASGASFAVAASLMLSGGSPFTGYWLARMGLTGAAFAGAVLAVLITLALAKGMNDRLRLLLAGVIVSVIFGALTSILVFQSPQILQPLQSFLLGSTSFIGWSGCVLMDGVLIVSLLSSTALSRVLDALILGERTAASLGAHQAALRVALILVMSLATGAAVAQTGLVAFVGLVAPHLARSFVLANHTRLITLSSFMGGALLLAADILARGLLAPEELPVGVLTAVLGGTYLCWLMYRQSTRISHS